MKKFTLSTKIFALAFVTLIGMKMKAQCVASFISSQWAGGVTGFTSTSAPVTSLTTYYWNFGNGATYSATGVSGQGASQTYTANGTYTVTLFIMSVAPSCSSAVTQTIAVTNATTSSGCNLVAGCSNYLGGPGQMGFTNNSTGTVSATTYTWDYGDSFTSNGVNGLHTYAANGTYTVTLHASNNSTPACTSTNTLQVTITTVCNLNASFNVSQGSNGLVNFISTSTGTAGGYIYLWNFGDGYTGSGASAAHTYTNGTYTVTLTVKNSSVAATCTSIASQIVAVSSNTCFLQSSFSFTQGTSGLVNFTNASSNTNTNTTYLWNFGNGYTSNSSGNPSMTYLNGGTHTVKLTIIDGSSSTCSSVAIQTINITSVACTANANFSLSYANSPGYWNATPAYPWNVANAQWSWGDGSTSNAMFTSHTYSVSGNYIICLSVTLTCGATASTCSTYSIYKSQGSQASAIYQVNVLAPELKSIDNTNAVGFSEIDTQSLNVSIYPNPASGQFAVMVRGIQTTNNIIIVRDLLGKQVLSFDQESVNGQFTRLIDLGSQSSGIYFLTISSGEHSITKKIVINN